MYCCCIFDVSIAISDKFRIISLKILYTCLLLCSVKLKWILPWGCIVKGGYYHQKDALHPSLFAMKKNQVSHTCFQTTSYLLLVWEPLLLYAYSLRISFAFSKSCIALRTVLGEKESSLAIVLMLGQHFFSLLHRS